MLKKLKTLCCVVLLIALCVPAFGTISKSLPKYLNNDRFYVGGTGPGNYTKIQDAINDSSNGNLIFVYSYSSPYYENLIVNKSIELIGESPETTIIDGGERKDVITINNDNVRISEFTIQRDGWYDDGIRLNANRSTIEGNIFLNNGAGIYSIYSNYHKITDNKFIDNYDGLKLIESNLNIITNNYFDNNYFSGIALFSSNNNSCNGNIIFGNSFPAIQHSYNGFRVLNSNNNTFYNNTIVSILDNCNAGIDLWESNNNIIAENRFVKNGLIHYKSYQNTIKNNTVNGKPLVYLVNKTDISINNAGQVILYKCNQISIKDLELHNIEVGIDMIESLDCFIFNNTITKCWYGVDIDSSKAIEISNNTISKNSYGIKIDMISSHNSIVDNHIISNKYSGILCSGSHNLIVDNIVDNNSIGVWIGGVFCKFGLINSNFISNNTLGLYLASTRFHTVLLNTFLNNSVGINLSLSFLNKIQKNNFMDNELQAVFENSFLNRWIHNFWKGDILPPHKINGRISIVKRHPWSGAIIWQIQIPWSNFDWRNSIKPFGR